MNGKNHESESSVIEVINAWIDGTASAHEATSLLNKRLVNQSHDEGELERLVDHLLLHSLLKDELSPTDVATLIDLATEPYEQQSRERTLGRGLRRWSWTALAAGLLFPLLLSLAYFQQTAVAAPKQILRTAIEIHNQPLERVYSVEVSRSDLSDVVEEVGRHTEVSTQGDRFWVSMSKNNNEWAWGRERDGSVWLALGPRAAMRIDAAEVGPAIDSFAEVYSLNIESLLNEVLQHCELQRSQSDELAHVITARGSKSSRNVTRDLEALIEIDIETKAIRRLTLVRRTERRSRTVMFSLIETRPVSEHLYSAKGHVNSDTRIITGELTRNIRRNILTRRFGRFARDWIVDPE